MFGYDFERPKENDAIDDDDDDDDASISFTADAFSWCCHRFVLDATASGSS